MSCPQLRCPSMERPTPYLEVHGEEYLGFTAYDPATNRIIWAIHFDDPFGYGNLRKLNHEYLHWILETFVSVEASVKLDNIMEWGYFKDELTELAIPVSKQTAFMVKQ